MDPVLQQKLDLLEKKVDAVYVSTEKTRKYFLWTLIATLIAFVLPLFGLMFAIPSLISTYSDLSSMGL